MAESHVISALTQKRSELLGVIDHHKKEIKRVFDELTHINASIKIFNPDFNLREIKAKQFRQPCKFFRRGERAILVLDILRESDKPLTSEEVTSKIKAQKGIVEDISKTVYNSLKSHFKNGVIEKVNVDIGLIGWQIKQGDSQNNNLNFFKSA